MGQEGEKYMLSLRRHVVATPRYEITIILSIVFIIIASYLISFDIWKTILFFGLPYIIVILLDILIIRFTRIYFPSRRIITLNLVVAISAIVQIAIFQLFYPFEFSLFLAFSSATFLRTLVYYVFMRRKPGLAILTSLNYNVIYAIMLPFVGKNYILPFIVSTTIYTVIALLILKISTVQFIKEFGEDPLWFISSFVNYLSNETKENVHHINRFFESIYDKRKTPVSTLIFWKGEKPKAIFVFPYIHPGPFGNVGGSNLTKKLRDFTGMSNLLVFHTTTTHDNNVANDKDVKKIAGVIKRSLNSQKKYEKMSDIYRFKIDGFEVLTQIFGKYAFVSLLPTNNIFDDVDLESGLILRNKLSNIYEDSAIVDAHNNFDENATPLSLKNKDINRIVERMKNIKADAPIKMGYSQRLIKGDSVGPDGIKVAVFEYKNKKMGYILVDGNNIKKGFRDKVKSSVKELLDDVEIFSTDNHIVNYDILDLNPFGSKDSWEDLIKNIRDAIKDAINNIEDVKVSMHTENVEFIMARRGQLKKMSDITKEALRRVKISIPLLTLGGFFGALLSFIYL